MSDSSASEGVEGSASESDATGSEGDARSEGSQEACPRVDASSSESASGSEGDSSGSGGASGEASGSEGGSGEGDSSGSGGDISGAEDDASDASGSEKDTSGEGDASDASTAASGSDGSDGECTRASDDPSDGGEEGDKQCQITMADACASLPKRWQPWHAGKGFLRKRKAITLLFPCAGFDSPGRSMSELNLPYKVMGAWEMADGPCKVLRSMYSKRPDRVNFHYGPQRGDVCSMEPNSLPDAEGLISGPPCPPFSSMGKTGGWRDPRAKVLLRILRWLRVLVRRGCLRFFILENVRGILHARWKFLRRLRKVLLPGWHVEVLRMSAESTAQSRNRVYVVGVRCPGGMSPGKKSIKGHLLKLPRRPLSSVILKLPNTKKMALTSQQRAKLQDCLRRVAKRSRTGRGGIAVYESNRNFGSSFSGSRVDDLAPCLRHSGIPLWLISMGKPAGSKVFRFLHPAERCLLQGIDPRSLPESVTEREIVQGCGNAMAVPAIGNVIRATILFMDGMEDDSSSS